MDNVTKIEKITLEDGRYAERHIRVSESGEKIIELFSEEPRALKLEKRITEKTRQVVAEQKVETIKDGEIVGVQVQSIEPSVKLELREHLGVVDNSQLGNNSYISRKELGPAVADAVVAGLSVVLEQQAALAAQSTQKMIVTKAQQAEMAAEAKTSIETRIEDKKAKKMDVGTLVTMIIVIIVQLGLFGYLAFGM